MITQKMISVKLDIHQLEKLDKLCSELCVNRNKFINFAVSRAVEALDPPYKLVLTKIYGDCVDYLK